MLSYHSLLIDDEQQEKSVGCDFLQLHRTIFGPEDNLAEKDIESLVYQIVNKPRNLLLHLQRIFACYQQNRPEQLYAAFVDFFSLLAGKGRSLARRMLNGARGRLNDEQLETLQLYLKGQWIGYLPVNTYSVLAQDLVGTPLLIEKNDNEREDYDYLNLARDYIEYSQLDSAMELLEEGMEKFPSWEDLQAQLLELYRVTDNENRFRAMYASALNNNNDLISGWKQLDHYFNGRKK
ncbi:type IV pilus assembly protein FimV [Methylomarinum vadi]|uniref:type IV pilus assembly protein FimV n=1 Tax=Methylomarinum vadi TaxID=438855 RepID=UPI0004DF2C7D|nr:hypothetical protein [Methylomarinum vadi]